MNLCVKILRKPNVQALGKADWKSLKAAQRELLLFKCYGKIKCVVAKALWISENTLSIPSIGSLDI